jgi:hypothetical protein
MQYGPCTEIICSLAEVRRTRNHNVGTGHRFANKGS